MEKKPHIKPITTVLASLLSVASILCTCVLILTLAVGQGSAEMTNISIGGNHQLTNRFNMFITNVFSEALDKVLEIDKIYFLNDADQIAPEPNQDNFGQTSDPTDLQWLLDDASKVLDGQQTLFSTDIEIYKDSTVNYYLDETIFTVTWKQVINDIVYTISEVKIVHPSQFRRFLADNQFSSSRKYLTSQMSATVNAVVASAGDFCKYRYEGITVYNHVVERCYGTSLDTCFIDRNGDLIFSPAGELTDLQSVKRYVEDKDIRFSVCFGPILIKDYERCEPKNYPIGEINDNYSRAALCQMDSLHYLLITANAEGLHCVYPNIHTFADVLQSFGVRHAYTLDGGQTATIVMNDKVINRVNYGAERYISDIIYFATAIPEINNETTGS